MMKIEKSKRESFKRKFRKYTVENDMGMYHSASIISPINEESFEDLMFIDYRKRM